MFSYQRNIWLAGWRNTEANGRSCLVTPYDWHLNCTTFTTVDRLWGPHTIDRFAAENSSHIKAYNSLYRDPNTQGVDPLSQQDWWEHNNFVNAPFFLIPKILQVLQKQRAHVTLVARVAKKGLVSRATEFTAAPPPPHSVYQAFKAIS